MYKANEQNSSIKLCFKLRFRISKNKTCFRCFIRLNSGDLVLSKASSHSPVSIATRSLDRLLRRECGISLLSSPSWFKSLLKGFILGGLSCLRVEGKKNLVCCYHHWQWCISSFFSSSFFGGAHRSRFFRVSMTLMIAFVKKK